MAETQLARVRNTLLSAETDFKALNLTGLNFAKEVEFATQIFAKNTYLQGADPASIKNAIVNIALTGISLNPVLKFCYIIPRKEKQVLQAIAEPSYMGLCKILTDTGSVIAISATIVYEKEAPSLKIQQGAGGYASHTPYIGFDKPGKPVACYSVAILPDGTKHVELLRPWEWEAIKKRSESVKSYNAKIAKGEKAFDTTWMTDEEEMIRKTCLKKHYKYLPKTEQALRISAAIDMDNQANGIDFDKQHGEPVVNVNTTPNAPAEDALATDDDVDEIFQLLANPVLPEFIFNGTVNKSKMVASIGIKQQKGTLEKHKAEQYIIQLKEQVEYFTKNPAQPTAPPKEEPAAESPKAEAPKEPVTEPQPNKAF